MKRWIPFISLLLLASSASAHVPKSLRLNEQLAWTFDKADNLQYHTNGAPVQTFTTDPNGMPPMFGNPGSSRTNSSPPQRASVSLSRMQP